MQAAQFVLGYEKTPEWFNMEAKKGKIRIHYNDDRELEYAHIISGLKTYVAKKGDIIINGKNGIVVTQKKIQRQFKSKEKMTK